MGNYDFSYEMPENFDSRLQQLLRQLYNNSDLANAFGRCTNEWNDEGLAFYAGMRGDNWNQRALDFIIEGNKDDIETIKKTRRL